MQAFLRRGARGKLRESVMSGLLFDRQRAAAADLARLIEDRRREETALRSHYDQADQDARRKGEETLRRLGKQRDQELADLDAAFHRAKEELTARYQSEREAEEKGHHEASRRLDFELRE